MPVAGDEDDVLLDDSPFIVPDVDLRWRVTGQRGSEEEFRTLGRQSAQDLARAIRPLGQELTDFERILDFGCGCGRVVRHLSKLAETSSLHGCDVDAEAVVWSSTHLPFARFTRNEGWPPTSYDDGMFDLVVNHSVFTHLPEDYQDAWLAELQRIVRPGGILVLSVSGLHAFAGLVKSYVDVGADPSWLEATMRDPGFLYIADDGWRDTCLPAFYHSAFHAPGYVFEHWGEFFEIVAYYPRGALGFQDIAVCRRP
jgi:SAM-dependent methyltransferase